MNVWLHFTQATIYGPVMFSEGIVGVNNYVEMEQFLEPGPRDGGIFDTVVLQQDRAPPHSARCVKYLNEIAPERWIGRASLRLWARCHLISCS